MIFFDDKVLYRLYVINITKLNGTSFYFLKLLHV